MLVIDMFAKQKFLIDPNSVFLEWWQLACFALTMGTALLSPYEVAFVAEGGTALLIINWCFNMFFICDILISFRTRVVYYNVKLRRTVQISETWALAKNYMCRWFIVDILSVIPFELFSPARGTRMLRCLRLAKLLRVVRCSRALAKVRRKLVLSYAAQDLIGLVVMALILAHWMACAVALVSFDPFDPDEPEWGWYAKLLDPGDGSRPRLAVEDVQKDHALVYLYAPHARRGPDGRGAHADVGVLLGVGGWNCVQHCVRAFCARDGVQIVD
jgi:hypothetical protein